MITAMTAKKVEVKGGGKAEKTSRSASSKK
jgi:hypothetical protein